MPDGSQLAVDAPIEACVAAIRAAFPETPLHANAILQAPYATNDDAYELQQILANHTWPEISRRDLFRHREMLVALTGEAYRADVPAYLLAALAEDDEYSADLREYLVHSLSPLSESAVHQQTAAERVSRLDDAQRAAITATLRILAETHRDRVAATFLAR